MQVGFLVLVGLAAKNAILIVEFAKELHEGGKSRYDATVEACRLRLRPIVMTAFAFILGVVPLVLAEGAGAEMRRSLGTAVFSGMIGVTAFGIFLTPVFFYLISRSKKAEEHRTRMLLPDFDVMRKRHGGQRLISSPKDMSQRHRAVDLRNRQADVPRRQDASDAPELRLAASNSRTLVIAMCCGIRLAACITRRETILLTRRKN